MSMDTLSFGISFDVSQADQNLNTFTDSLKRFTEQTKPATAGLDSFNDAEKQAIASMLASKAALEARAQAAGVSVATMKAVEAQLRRETEAAAENAVAMTKGATAIAQTAKDVDTLGHSSGFGRMQMLELGHVVRAVSGEMMAGGSATRAIGMELPRIGQIAIGAAGSLAGLGSALGALAPFAAPVSLALGTAATAGIVLANACDTAETETRALEQADIDLVESVKGVIDEQTKANATWKKFTDIAKDASSQVDIINGKTSAAAVAGEKQAKQAKDAAHDQLLADGRRVASLTMAIDAAERLSRDEDAGADARIAASASIAKNKEELDKATTSLKDHKAALKAALGDIQTTTDYNVALADSEDFLRQRSDAAAKAAKEEAAARKAAAAAAAEERKFDDQIKKQVEAYDKADEIVARSAAFRTATETRTVSQIIAARDDDLHNFNSFMAGTTNSTLTTMKGRLAITQAYERQITAARENEEKKRAKEEAAAEKKRLEEARAAAEARLQMEQDVAGSLSDIGNTLASSLGESNKRGAMIAYGIAKAAALTQIGINEAQGLSAASALLPPADAYQAIKVTAANAAAAAAVIAQPPPTFANDTPGVMKNNSTGRTQVSLAGDDYWAAAKDPAALRAQVGGGGGTTVLRIGRLESTEIARTDIRANGQIPTTIRRIVRRASSGSGRSGRPPRA